MAEMCKLLIDRIYPMSGTPQATTSPTTTAAAPPTINQIDLSVGLPVKTRETSELKECDAFKPNIKSTMPTAKTANPTMLFIPKIRHGGCSHWGLPPNRRFQTHGRMHGGLPSACVASTLRYPQNMATKHTWRFFRAGGFDQVRLDSGADLMNLDQLDQKLWVALACPTSGLEFDSKTLALIDTDRRWAHSTAGINRCL